MPFKYLPFPDGRVVKDAGSGARLCRLKSCSYCFLTVQPCVEVLKVSEPLLYWSESGRCNNSTYYLLGFGEVENKLMCLKRSVHAVAFLL